MEFYEKVSDAYMKVFKRIGFETYVTEAAGGVFTENRTREFQVVADAGEDTIYVEKGSKKAVNKEIFDGDKEEYEEKRSIEVGNIFPFGDKRYAEKMNVTYTDRDGQKKLVHFASYGIGVTRLLGTAVEVFHDEKGIIWPKSIAPFDVHLIELKTQSAKLKTEDIYNKLNEAGIEVLWDDRDVSAGEKFADADLIGIPVRLVVSNKTGDKVEWKERTSDKAELIEIDEIINKLK